MTTIVGLDLSLTSTGVALIAGNDISTYRVRSKGSKDASIADTALRLDTIAQFVIGWATDEWSLGLDLAVIEAPSFGSRNGSQHERGGLWWKVAGILWEMDVPIATVAPTTRAKYATGSGKADKDEVLAAAIKRYPAAEITGNDVADAVVLAAMGARHLGVPVEDSLPAKSLEAMATAKWPK